MDSWTWRFHFERSSKLLFFNASRVEYVLRPIADPANDRLFINY